MSKMLTEEGCFSLNHGANDEVLKVLDSLECGQNGASVYQRRRTTLLEALGEIGSYHMDRRVMTQVSDITQDSNDEYSLIEDGEPVQSNYVGKASKSRYQGRQRAIGSVGVFLAIFQCLFGSGMLSIPIIFKEATVPYAIVICFCQMALSCCSFLLWAVAGWLSGGRTFIEAFVLCIYGEQGLTNRKSGAILSFCMLGLVLMLMMCKATVFGDILPIVLNIDAADKTAWYAGRELPLVIYMAVVQLPLTIYGELGDLSVFKFTWIVGIAACLYTIVVLVVDTHQVGSTISKCPKCMSNPNAEETVWGVVKGVSVFSATFMAHFMAPKLFIESSGTAVGACRADVVDLKKFSRATIFAFIAVALLYCLFGYVGVVRFGEDTDGNLLQNYLKLKGGNGFSPGVSFAYIQSCAVVICLTLSVSMTFCYNMLFQSAVNLLNNALEKTMHRNMPLENRPKSFIVPSKFHKVVWAVLITALLAVSGAYWTAMDEVLFFRGATFDVFITFHIPSAMVIRAISHFKDQVNMSEMKKKWLVRFSYFFFIYGTLSIILNFVGLGAGQLPSKH